MIEIKKHNAPYVLMEMQLRVQANTYAERARVYIEEGKLDKAIGCLDKAVKKIKRADMLKLSPLEEVVFGPLLNKLSEQIVKSIMGR